MTELDLRENRKRGIENSQYRNFFKGILLLMKAKKLVANDQTSEAERFCFYYLRWKEQLCIWMEMI